MFNMFMASCPLSNVHPKALFSSCGFFKMMLKQIRAAICFRTGKLRSLTKCMTSWKSTLAGKHKVHQNLLNRCDAHPFKLLSALLSCTFIPGISGWISDVLIYQHFNTQSTIQTGCSDEQQAPPKQGNVTFCLCRPVDSECPVIHFCTAMALSRVVSQISAKTAPTAGPLQNLYHH